MVSESLERALDFQQHYEDKVAAASDYIGRQLDGRRPVFGIVLGSGLGDLANSIDNPRVIPYSEIPNFPQPTVQGHQGTMVIGDLEGVSVIGLKGRKHYYEVADGPFNTGMLQVVFPVHVLADLGIGNYFVTNAAGGLNADYAVGDIMIIRSHISLMPNALLGRHHDFKKVDDGSQTLRFQPMNEAYDSGLRSRLLRAGSAHSDRVHQGVYLAVTGPTYETEGECLAFRDGLGADAVGMSTAPEVIVARNRGMKAVGMSCITNAIAEDGANAADHEEVKRILESPEVRGRLLSTVRNFFSLCRESGGLF